MSTVVFYSAAFGAQEWGAVTEQCNNALLSFFYAQTAGNNFLQERREGAPHVNLMVDSGTHTFLTSSAGEKMKYADQWQDYVKSYSEWLRANKEYIYCAVELDVGGRLGLPIVRKWEEQYFKPLEYEGMQIIYVYHPEQHSYEEWERMCRENRYVGLTFAVFKDRSLGKLMRCAYRYRTKVHGFAITSHKVIRDLSLATVDSTTWLARSTRFGEWVIWTGAKIYIIKDKDARPRYRDLVESFGFDFDKMLAEDRLETIRWNLHEFRRMEKVYAERNKDRAYWKVRAPYPEVVAKMSDAQVTAWVKGLRLKDTQATSREALNAVSLLQNSRLTEYLKEAEHNNAILTECTGMLAAIDDQRSMDSLRDAFNGQFDTQITAKFRTTEEAWIPNFDTLAREESEEQGRILAAEEDHELNTLKGYNDEEDEDQG